MTDQTAGGRLRLFGWVLLGLAVVGQVAGLYAPTVPGPDGIPGLDKVGHFLAFAVPAFLARLLGARWMMLLLLVHALVAEPLQHTLTSNRVAELGDALANLVGLAVGALAARLVARWRHDGGMPSVDDRERAG
ncbi:VanZ family protein [Ornithinimicrobium pratense]|uniref:VanZ family protein n=1 Tax=Ornithinimicrobium pratense TaxID=2593973 RepID=A0A5J6V7G4_9MICO|nr:VanZ family protein [Ornithinimicrobium pratense]QFG69023.1 VanZ family protein [Ornithinimicrobium pratense]